MSTPLPFQNDEIVALLRPAVDAHTLGVSSVAGLIASAGYGTCIAAEAVADALNRLAHTGDFSLVADWLRERRATRVGFSYRLDPRDAVEGFARVLYHLENSRLLVAQGGRIRAVYFAGLPPACAEVQVRFDQQIPVFRGDESALETAERLGIDRARLPDDVTAGSEYDERRMEFARTLVQRGEYAQVQPLNRRNTANFGTGRERLVERVDEGRRRELPPLMRVHAGPYHPDPATGVQTFIEWAARLAHTGLLDILSIGTSQLSQSNFGEDWGNQPNGGGVPVRSEDDYRRIAAAARPMLVRTYAGTRNVPALARVHERVLDNAWHALSFWWFSQLDGRGPNDVLANLVEHHQTLDYIAQTGKPFEPNIPHHFSFRGGDDVTYVLSGYLAARTAKERGVRTLVLQIMLNTPKPTLGVQDLAKARALLSLVRELEDENFRVLVQPRAGLDYFSPDLAKARAQLAAVTALMVDLEPQRTMGPDIIHVVSYSEAVRLADPEIIDESIRITRRALSEYRDQRQDLRIDQALDQAGAEQRTQRLIKEVRFRRADMERAIPDLYSPAGLYLALAAGYLVAPSLWGRQDEFAFARSHRTAVRQGGVQLVDASGHPLDQHTLVAAARDQLAQIDQAAVRHRARALEAGDHCAAESTGRFCLMSPARQPTR